MRNPKLPEVLGTKYTYREASEMSGINADSAIYASNSKPHFVKLVLDLEKATTEILGILEEAKNPVSIETTTDPISEAEKDQLCGIVNRDPLLSNEQKAQILEAFNEVKDSLSKEQSEQIIGQLRKALNKIMEAFNDATIASIFHFLLGPQQPKARLFAVDSGLCVASRLAQNVKTLHEFYSFQNPKEGLGPHNQDYLEHYPGGLLYNLWVKNEDFHYRNVLAGEKDSTRAQAIFIDFGIAAWQSSSAPNYTIGQETFHTLFNAQDIAHLPFVGPKGGRGGTYTPHNWLGVCCYVQNVGSKSYLKVFRNDPNTYENPRFQSDLHWAMLRLWLIPKKIISIFAEENREVLQTLPALKNDNLPEMIFTILTGNLEKSLEEFISHSATIPGFIQYLKNISILDLALMAREFRDACARCSKTVRSKLIKILGEDLESIFENCLKRLRSRLNQIPAFSGVPLLKLPEEHRQRWVQFALQGDHENTRDPDLRALVLHHKIRRGEAPFLQSSNDVSTPSDLAEKIRLGHALLNQLLENFNLEDFRQILECLQKPLVEKPQLSQGKNPDSLLFLRLDGMTIRKILTHYFPHTSSYENQCLALSFQKLLESAREQKIRKLELKDNQSLMGYISSGKADKLAKSLLTEFVFLSTNSLSLAATRENIVQNAYKFAKKIEADLSDDQKKALGLLAHYVRQEDFYSKFNFLKAKIELFLKGELLAILFVNWAFDPDFFKSQITQDSFLKFVFAYVFSDAGKMRVVFANNYFAHNENLKIEDFFSDISKCAQDFKDSIECPLNAKGLKEFYNTPRIYLGRDLWGDDVRRNFELISCLDQMGLKASDPDLMTKINEMDLRQGELVFLIGVFKEIKKASLQKPYITAYTAKIIKDPKCPINAKQIKALYDEYESDWGEDFWAKPVHELYNFINSLCQSKLADIAPDLIEKIKEIDLRAEKVEFLMEIFMKHKEASKQEPKILPLLEELRDTHLNPELREITRISKVEESTLTALVNAFFETGDSEKTKDLAYLIAFCGSPERNALKPSAKQLYTYFETLGGEKFTEIKKAHPIFFDLNAFEFPKDACDLTRLNLMCRRIFLGIKKEDQEEALNWLKQIYSNFYISILFSINHEGNCETLFKNIFIDYNETQFNKNYATFLEAYFDHPIFKLLTYSPDKIMATVFKRNTYPDHHKEQLRIVHELLNNSTLAENEYAHLKKQLKHHPLQDTSAKFVFELMNILEGFSKGKALGIQENISNLISSLFYVLSYEPGKNKRPLPKEENTKLYGKDELKLQQLAQINQNLIQRSEKLEKLQGKKPTLGFNPSPISNEHKTKILQQIQEQIDLQISEKFKNGSKIYTSIVARQTALKSFQEKLNGKPMTWIEVDLELRKLENNADINYHKTGWKNHFRFFNTQARKDIQNLRLGTALDCKASRS